MNLIKTTFLLSLLTMLMVFMGSAIGGQGGMFCPGQRSQKAPHGVTDDSDDRASGSLHIT